MRRNLRHYLLPVLLAIAGVLVVAVALSAVETSPSPKASPLPAQRQTLPDVPELQEKFLLVFEVPGTVYAGLDPRTIREEEDGSVSVRVYMRFIDQTLQTKLPNGVAVAVGGRIAFRCHSEQMKVLANYVLSAANEVLQIKTPDTTFAGFGEDTPASAIAQFVCDTHHPTIRGAK